MKSTLMATNSDLINLSTLEKVFWFVDYIIQTCWWLSETWKRFYVILCYFVQILTNYLYLTKCDESKLCKLNLSMN